MVRFCTQISWDVTDEDFDSGEALPTPEELGLPTRKEIVADIPAEVAETIINTMDADAVIDALSDHYGYCIVGFVVNIEEE